MKHTATIEEVQAISVEQVLLSSANRYETKRLTAHWNLADNGHMFTVTLNGREINTTTDLVEALEEYNEL